MTKKEFQDGIDSIQVDGETREKLWSQLCEKQLQRGDDLGKKFYFPANQGRRRASLWKTWTPVAAVLLICVILIPGIVYADEIVNYFRGHLSQDPDLASDVNQSVFQDGDEHVSMEVCEWLSDGYASCMTVKYTALDKMGREWLFGETLKDASPDYRADQCLLTGELEMVPIGEDGEETLTSAFYGTKEIEEERTKTSRVFFLDYTANAVGSNRCRLTYPLFEKSSQKELTAKNLLKTYTYALDGECSSANYIPRYLRISKIGYVVYGENHGIYRRYEFGFESTSDEDIDSATLYFNNRAPLALLENAPAYGFLGAVTEPGESTCNMDLCVLYGEFDDPAEWIPFEDSKDSYDGDGLEIRIDHRLAIDPEDVQKLEINGDMYTLSRVD